MPYQTPLQLTGASPSTIDDLLKDPSRARDLIIHSIPELLAHLAGRVAALKTLEGTLLSIMLSHRVGTSNGRNGDSALLSAPQVAKLFDVPAVVRLYLPPGVDYTRVTQLQEYCVSIGLDQIEKDY